MEEPLTKEGAVDLEKRVSFAGVITCSPPKEPPTKVYFTKLVQVYADEFPLFRGPYNCVEKWEP